MSRRLTRLAHELAEEILSPGDRVVDATAGNGHDTLFLAEQVGAAGKVWAFDVQAAALAATRERLAAAGCAARVELIHAGHETLAERLPSEEKGRLAAVFFNLGYLPRGDHALITRGETTRTALDAATEWVRLGGHLSLLVYPGHPGGVEEAQMVREWIAEENARWAFFFHGEPEQNERPWLAVGRRI